MIRLLSRLVLLALAALSLGALTGCGGDYTIHGKVVMGPIAAVELVDADDPRLAGPGIEHATVDFILDPRSLGRKHLGATYSAEDGSFHLAVDEFGAGLLEYEIQVLAKAKKHRDSADNVKMPPRGKRILVTMAPGRGTAPHVKPFETIDSVKKEVEEYLDK
jgi:hypothetical protein